MKTIRVAASTEYDVLVGKGLICHTAQYLRAVCDGNAVCIVSDDTVWALYGVSLENSLNDAGYRCVHFTFTPGEQRKNLQTYGNLLAFLADSALTRNDCIIALGGGVVGDLAGFTAATYLRGIPYMQIPTTLLAMVDSSVGGKTAIDLPKGKNLAGAFYQPKLVICDTDTLTSLPDAVFRDGCAEVIKYGILYDPALLASLEQNGLRFDREAIISRCVELKRDVVAGDEYDRGQRMLLNFGHTIGHGIEAASGFTVSHGCAVAIGMAIMSRACAAQGICSKITARRIIALLDLFRLPYSTELSVEAITKAALSDKKRNGDAIHLVVCKDIGCCEILSIPTERLLQWLQAGLCP